MVVSRITRMLAAVPIAVLAFAVSAQPAAAPAMPSLGLLESGSWTLKPRDGTGAPRTMCLGDRSVLLQIQHGEAHCQRFVLENDPTSVTVSYSCPGAGNGRTTVKVETPRLIRVDTQGIDHGSPFDVSMEGRRTGMCQMPTR